MAGCYENQGNDAGEALALHHGRCGFPLHPWEASVQRLKNSEPHHAQSKMVVTGLTPGAAYVFRIRAIGAAGAGPWSDIALRRAP